MNDILPMKELQSKENLANNNGSFDFSELAIFRLKIREKITGRDQILEDIANNISRGLSHPNTNIHRIVGNEHLFDTDYVRLAELAE